MKKSSEAGKGSIPRPLGVSREVYEKNFKYTFCKDVNGKRKQTRKKNRAV
jgi:hypothetical protein